MLRAPGKWKALIFAGLIFLSACDSIHIYPQAPTTFPGMLDTLAVGTMSAELTRRPHTPTAAPDTPTPTLSYTSTLNPALVTPPTRTPLPSLTPTSLPTATVPMLLPDGSLAPCNAAQFIQDVSIPDGTLVRPGQKFTKVWEFKNVGNCIWTEDYALVQVYGHPMGVASPVPLRQIVHPGENVEISLQMMAPYIPACWVGWWKFQDEEGNEFGIDFKFGEVFWVKVAVYIPGLRFTKDACLPQD